MWVPLSTVSMLMHPLSGNRGVTSILNDEYVKIVMSYLSWHCSDVALILSTGVTTGEIFIGKNTTWNLLEANNSYKTYNNKYRTNKTNDNKYRTNKTNNRHNNDTTDNSANTYRYYIVNMYV